MKKKVFLVLGIAIVFFLVYFFGPGFMMNTTVLINDYKLSADGTKMTINVGVASSAGYVRDVKVHQQQGGELDIDCYSAFGGFNGSVEVKDTFTFTLNEDTSVIALNRDCNVYEEVLVKDKDGIWVRTEQLN